MVLEVLTRVRSVAIFCLLLTGFSGTAQSMSEIRSEFHSAVLNPDETESFYDFIKKIEDPSATIKAYQAVSEAMLAQGMWNPFSKLKQVMKYEKQMTAAIEADPMNIEIRFLRLAIEHNLPSFLGMSKHLDEDVSKIVANLSNISTMQVNPIFGKYIFYFLKETNLCSQEELDRMRVSFEQASSPAGAE